MRFEQIALIYIQPNASRAGSPLSIITSGDRRTNTLSEPAQRILTAENNDLQKGLKHPADPGPWGNEAGEAEGIGPNLPQRTDRLR